MSTYRYNVSLRIWHPSRDPADFSSTLDLAPKFFDVAGSPRVRKGKTLAFVAKESYWSHEFVYADEKDLEDFLLEKATSLHSHYEFFSDIRSSGGRSEFFIGFYPENFDCGFELSPELQRRCADLNLSLSFDIYGLSDSGANST